MYLLVPIVECTYMEIYILDINSTILSPHVNNAGVLKPIEKAHLWPWRPNPPPRPIEAIGLLPQESRSRINTGFVAVVLTASVPIAGNTHKRWNEAFIYYNRL